MKLLNQPGTMGPLKLKNRVIMAPLGTNYGTTDGFSTERDRQYYKERAIGGVAMIMTEAMIVTPGARNHHNSLCIFHDRYIPGVAAVAESIKSAGALVVGQISHRGGLLRRDVLNMEPVGPSEWRNPNTNDLVRPLRPDEIVSIEKDYVKSARRLWQAGYDGVELHAANGYLFHQFFTPRVNKRTDAYGGTLRNRMRFLLETIDRIKDALPDFPVIVRYSATEFVDGGYTVEDSIALAQALEQAGVAALDMSGGTNESPELSRFCIQTPSFARRCLEPYVRPIKEAVGIPVIVAGRIVEPNDAEAILADGSADFISLGRALVSDPHWCLKAFGELDQPIRRCISCNVCFERLTLERDTSCVQNPMAGTEFESLEHMRAEPVAPALRRRVLVVGGGVAGIEAANVAATRGHQVEVWEAATRAGGQIAQAIAAPDKEEVGNVWEDRLARFKQLGLTLRLNKVATVEEVERFAPDFVIVATGSRPRAIELPWPKSVKALQSWDVLTDATLVPPGSEVLMIGGGMVGIETADLLVTTGCKVTIVEALPTIAKEMARNNRTEVLLRLKAAGTRIFTGAWVEGVEGDDLVVKRDGATNRIPLPRYVVMAIGPRPNRDFAEQLEKTSVPFVVVGDAAAPGDFLAAVRDGWMAGLSIEHRKDLGACVSSHATKRH